MRLKKVIFAENYEQYIRCCHHNNLNPKYVPFITSINQIEEIRESISPVYFGAFWEHPGYKDMERAMKSKGINVGGKRINLDRRPPGELEDESIRKSRIGD